MRVVRENETEIERQREGGGWGNVCKEFNVCVVYLTSGLFTFENWSTLKKDNIGQKIFLHGIYNFFPV